MSVDTQAADVLNGATGRTLREGTTVLEKQQTNRIQEAQKIALLEIARDSRFPAEKITDLWQRQKDYGDVSVKRLSESVSEGAMPQLLRAGVQNFLFDGYADVPVIYPDLVRPVSSGKAEELYAPLYGTELPTQIAPGQEYGDSRLLGLDVHVPNQKFGRMLSIERELVEDDQTGQIVDRAGRLGNRMRYSEETQVINAITAAAYTTAIGNVNSGGAQLSGPLLQGADIALEEILDPLGNKMLVMPDTLLVSPADKFNAAMLLNSALQPSVPGASGQTASTASSGGTGWTMTVNPLQGLYNLKVSRFLPTATGLDSSHGAWFLLEAKKSIVFQDRTALQVMQEAVNSGGSFSKDVFRYRVDRRFAAAVVESRYIYRGN